MCLVCDGLKNYRMGRGSATTLCSQVVGIDRKHVATVCFFTGPRGRAASFGGGDGFHERTGAAAISLEQPLAVEDGQTDKPCPLAASQGACRRPSAVPDPLQPSRVFAGLLNCRLDAQRPQMVGEPPEPPGEAENQEPEKPDHTESLVRESLVNFPTKLWGLPLARPVGFSYSVSISFIFICSFGVLSVSALPTSVKRISGPRRVC